MPDTKISALTDGTTANSTDRIPVARDAGGGTFNNRYVTPGYIGTTLLGSGTALTGSTVTTSSPVLNLTQTWDDGNVTFTGLLFNAAGASGTNSAAGSLLLDLQIGGATRFGVRKNGTGTTLIVADSTIEKVPGSRFLIGGATIAGDQVATTSIILGQNATVGRIATDNGSKKIIIGNADSASPSAQSIGVQSVVAGTSDTAGANLTITGSQGTGTGAGGSIIFQVAPAGSAGSSQNAYQTAFQINGNGGVTGQDGVTANTLALRNGGTSSSPVPQKFNIYNYWASASDYECLSLFFQSNIARIFVDRAGSGSDRDLALQGYGSIRLLPGNVDVVTISSTAMSIFDGKNIAFEATTGTKIGTATSQKIGFWNATPIVQPTTGVAEAAFVENSGGTAVNVDSTFGGYTLQQVVQALQNAGLLA